VNLTDLKDKTTTSLKLLKANPEGTDIQQIYIGKANGRYFITGPDSTAGLRYTLDGGSMILTKHKVIAASGFTFSDQAGWEAMSNKGALYARIQIDENNSDCYVHVFTTHTAAGDATDCRATQLRELIEFMEKCIEDDAKDNKLHPIILCGDFNIIGASQEYNNRLKNLAVKNRKLGDLWIGLGKIEEPKKDSATWVGKDKNTTGTPWGPKNTLARETGDFQRLDYFFIFEGEDAIKLNKKSIDREPDKQRDKPYKWSGIESYTLSDHLGLKAIFEANPQK